MIFKYFRELKLVVEKFDYLIASCTINEKTYSSEKGYIEGQIFFTDDSCLDFAEVKDIGIVNKIKFSYHYMDKENQLIFRYDNAKHFPNLSSFPNHKHKPDEVIESVEPKLENILQEISDFVVAG